MKAKAKVYSANGREEEMAIDYGRELGLALYWAWHRQPQRGDIIRAEIDRLRTQNAALLAALEEVREIGEDNAVQDGGVDYRFEDIARIADAAIKAAGAGNEK